MFAEARWSSAIESWRTGDPAPLAQLLNSGSALPRWVRSFLADVATGAEKKGKGGAPEKRSAEHKRAIWREVMGAMDRGLSAEQAADAVSKARRIGDGAVRRIVADMTKAGVTRELWLAKMRPKK